MKLLFENWRKYVAEADTDNDGIRDDRELAIIDAGELLKHIRIIDQPEEPGPNPLRSRIGPGPDERTYGGPSQVSKYAEATLSADDVNKIIANGQNLGEVGEDIDVLLQVVRDNNIYPDDFDDDDDGSLILIFKPDRIEPETSEKFVRRMQEYDAELNKMLAGL